LRVTAKGAASVTSDAGFCCDAQKGSLARVATYIEQVFGLSAEVQEDRAQPRRGLPWKDPARAKKPIGHELALQAVIGFGVEAQCCSQLQPGAGPRSIR
jgi:hypothetical protein